MTSRAAHASALAAFVALLAPWWKPEPPPPVVTAEASV
jgi:hypothetical protein